MAANPFKYRFTIDSRLRTSGTDSNFTYPIVLPPSMSDMDREGLHVVLLSCNIPKSYYIITAGENTFTVTEGAATITITILPGNCNALSFMREVLRQLNTGTQNGSVYSCTFGNGYANDGKYRWSVVGPAQVTFNVPAATGSGIYEQLGCVAGATYTLPYTSPNIVSFITQGTIQIHSNLVSANSDILSIVVGATNADYTSIIVLNTDLDARAQPLAETNFSSRNFFLTDEFGERVDLNGCPMFMELLIYRPFQFTVRKYMQSRSLSEEEETLKAILVAMQQMVGLQKKAVTVALQTAAAPPSPPLQPQLQLMPPNTDEKTPPVEVAPK